MESAIYLVSVKNTTDSWLPHKDVHYYSSLIRTLQSRLGEAKIIVSPICECLQFAGQFSTSSNPQLNIINELSATESPTFLSGLPSSLQHTRLAPLLIGKLNSPSELPSLIQYLSEASTNSIIFLEESLHEHFQNFVELRKETSRINIYRVIKGNSIKCKISECCYKKNKWSLKINNTLETTIGGLRVVVKESLQELAVINSIAPGCEVKIHVISKKISPGYRSFEKSLGDYALLVNYTNEEFDLYGKHVRVMSGESVLSGDFYIPEFVIEVALVDNTWVCRVKNCSSERFDTVEVFAGERSCKVDLSGVPREECALVRFHELKGRENILFYIKHKGSIVSNTVCYLYDSIDL